MTLVFYNSPMSTASLVHWALEELAVPYEEVRIDLAAQEQKKPEFLRINPNGKVPALVHEGTALFESLAIIIHLGETFGQGKGLYPPPGLQRAEALKWMVWCQVSVGEAVSRLLRNTSERIPAEQRNAKAAAVAREDLGQLLSILDTHLAGKTYLLGDTFSLADVVAGGWIGYFGFFGFDLSPYKNIGTWSERLKPRPARQRAMGG